MIVLRETDYATVPWKNGGGVTREIHRVPADGTVFDWRLSLATIDRAGPFSSFDGYERTLVLVRGAGVALDFGPQGHRPTKLATPGQVASFDGGWETTCTLLDGPSTDLNLIVAKERAQARASVARVAAPALIQTTGWTETLVCCVSGSVQITTAAGVTETLAAADTARCFPEDGTVTCDPCAAVPALLFIAAVRHTITEALQPAAARGVD